MLPPCPALDLPMCAAIRSVLIRLEVVVPSLKCAGRIIMFPGSTCDLALCEQDCLALGVIFAATDSVAVLQVLQQERMPLLYSLVFGEGVINDATSVALLRAVQVQQEADCPVGLFDPVLVPVACCNQATVLTAPSA